MRSAAESRSPIVCLADRYAVPFTAVSLPLAGIAWWMSGDPVRFAEVLFVTTPRPLLIAGPVAFLAGMSRAASSGVIVKSGGVLEALARARTVALDKTGTITHGHPVAAAIEPTGDADPDDILRIAAAVEIFPAHVLAKTIMHAAHEGRLLIPAVSAVEETTAAGMTATVLGRILLADDVRANAAATLGALRLLGIGSVAMLTVDAAGTARHVAERIGIHDVRAGLLPADKVAHVAGPASRPVAMVGDGVNDAPVLAAADIGIAMGAKGATAASESADVVITLDDIGRVATSIAIAQRTVRVALQAIWLGIVISVGLMLVALRGFLPAIVGGSLQEIVDLAAILMTLRAAHPGCAERELTDELRALAPPRDDATTLVATP